MAADLDGNFGSPAYRDAQRQARPCDHCRPARVCSSVTRTGRPQFRRPSASPGPLAIVDLVGKGGHVRTVPVPDWVKQFLDEWFTAAEINTGKFFRCVCRSGTVWGDGITEKVISSSRERPSRNRTDRVNRTGPGSCPARSVTEIPTIRPGGINA